MRLFVYGTLKRDDRAHYLLKIWNPDFIGEAKTNEDYHIYNQGAFPGLVKDATIEGGVHGELFEVSEECMKALDYYEGVGHGLYRREVVLLEDGSTATSYLMLRANKSRRIASGIWGQHGEEEGQED